MYRYWHPQCPVRTDHPQVLATAYVKPDGGTLIALASWAPEPVTCRLSLDSGRLGLTSEDAQVLTAPTIIGFQDAASYASDQAIPVEPGRGRILLLGVPEDIAAGSDATTDAHIPDEVPLTVPRRAAPLGLDEISGWLEAQAPSLPLVRDGMTCGTVRLGVAGNDLVVDIVSHDVELSRHPSRVDKSSGCELFVAANAAAPPIHWIFLPAVGEAPAEARAYRELDVEPVPAEVAWQICPQRNGYRLRVRAPLRACLGIPASRNRQM